MDTERQQQRARFAAKKQTKLSFLGLVLSVSTLLLATVSTATAASTVEYADGLILRQLHVVTRHGSRHALPKGADGMTPEQEKEEAVQLTAFGRKQMYDLGTWLSTTYYAKSQDAVISLESSPYDRTISSANSLALGLMNITSASIASSSKSSKVPMEILTGLPPVFMSEAHNDVYLRAYDKCPAFVDKLNALSTSAQWLQLQQDSMSLLQKLASIEEFQQYATYMDGGSSTASKTAYVPLTQIYNVFDTVHVAKTECAASMTLGLEFFTNELLPLQQSGVTCQEAIEDWISTQDWKELEQLAHTVELLKYNGGPHQKDAAANTEAGKLIGANLLSRIMQRLLHNSPDASSSSTTTATAPDLYVYSAHYPTVLGMFAALQEPFFVDTSLSDSTNVQNEQLIIPNYASALVFEYFEDTKATSAHAQFLLRVRFKNDANITTDDAGDLVTYSNNHATLVPLKTACTQKQGSDSITHDPTEYCPIEQLSNALWEVLHSDSDEETPVSWSDMPKSWCKACGNDKASPCIKQLLQEYQDGSASASETTGPHFWLGGASSTSNGHQDPSRGKSTTTASETCSGGSSATGGAIMTGILIGFALAVALVAMVWSVLWFTQLRDAQAMNKDVSGAMMKEQPRGVGNISTIMQETVGDDTIIEETADDVDDDGNNTMVVMSTTTTTTATEQNDEEEPKTLAETADMA